MSNSRPLVCLAVRAQGTCVAFALSPLLMGWAGWPTVFYAAAILSLLWAVAALGLLYDSPQLHPRLGHAEAHYLAMHIERTSSSHVVHGASTRVPWAQIFTRQAVLSLIVVFFAVSSPLPTKSLAGPCAPACQTMAADATTCAVHTAQGNYTWYTFLTFLPQFITTQLGFDLTASGLVGTLPYLGYIAGTIFFGTIADRLIASRRFTITRTRKLMHSIAAVISACMLLVVGRSSSVRMAVTVIVCTNFFYSAIGMRPPLAESTRAPRWPRAKHSRVGLARPASLCAPLRPDVAK